MIHVTGDKVYLRPLTLDDAAYILASTENDEIRYMTGTKKRFTLNEVRDFIEASLADDTRIDFAICRSETGEIIGDLSLVELDEENQKGHFRIALHSSTILGQGYGSEASRLALKYAFDELRLHRLELEVYSHNPRGIRAYEKAGFVQEGRLREAVFYNNQYSDIIIMGMLRSDYDKG